MRKGKDTKKEMERKNENTNESKDNSGQFTEDEFISMMRAIYRSGQLQDIKPEITSVKLQFKNNDKVISEVEAYRSSQLNKANMISVLEAVQQVMTINPFDRDSLPNIFAPLTTNFEDAMILNVVRYYNLNIDPRFSKNWSMVTTNDEELIMMILHTFLCTYGYEIMHFYPKEAKYIFNRYLLKIGINEEINNDKLKQIASKIESDEDISDLLDTIYIHIFPYSSSVGIDNSTIMTLAITIIIIGLLRAKTMIDSTGEGMLKLSDNTDAILTEKEIMELDCYTKFLFYKYIKREMEGEECNE